MTTEAKPAQADMEAAIAKAVGPLQAKIEELESKNSGLLDDLKKAQRELRAAKDITPEAHQAEVERADKVEAKLAELTAAHKALTAERDKAVKALEAEQSAARAYAIEAEVSKAIAEGNVVPALVPAFRALVAQGARAELADGRYSVLAADGKPIGETIKAILASEEGKHFVAAPANGGGGAPGSRGPAQGGVKTMTREQFQELRTADPAGAAKFFAEGGVIADAA